jgi:hypothetical protein
MGKNIISKIASALLTFKLILLLNDNWKNYQENGKFEVRSVEKREVEKMIDCMDPEKCYSVYMCEKCGETKVIPHSCKSRICSQCGKKHADEWAEKINKEMYAVPYRHVILTISDRLWSYFEGDAEMQKLMLDTAAKTMKDIVRNYNKKGKGAEPGIIMVLHPFGRDLKTNMHTHMLMTEGGLTKEGKWIEMPYIDYKLIRKKWQYEILTAMRKAKPEDKELSKIIDWCFRERTNGFNIQAKRRIEGKTKKAARYMARYVRHPAIADGRIINYDGENVTFKYEREEIEITVVMEKNEFIHNVIKHIPDKKFKMIRYFGIHARRAKARVKKIMKELGLLVEYLIKPFSWRKNKKEYEGKDPLACDKCGGEMHLYKVVYYDKNGVKREYGGMSTFLKKIIVGSVDDGKKEKKEKTVKDKGKEYDYRQICLQ